jgi:tyrosinase
LNIASRNIDRIFAIYQALYPSENLSWWVKEETTYKDKDGKEHTLVLTPQSPLAPFHKDTQGTTYDSNGVRHIVDLGYTYPELQRWNFDSDVAYRASITEKVNRLYEPPSELLVARADYIVNVVYER